MSKRLIASILLFFLGIAVVVIERGPIAGLLGPFFIVLALLLWVIPAKAFEGNPFKSDTLGNPIVLTVLGVGFGLIAAVAAANLLPPPVFSWLLILVGVILIVWLFIRSRRNTTE